MIAIETVEYIVIGVISLLILLNVILNFNKTENDTINVIIKNWAYDKYFFITFFWGVLGGHFFLGTTTPVFGTNWWLPVVLLVLITLVMLFVGKRLNYSIKIKSYHQFILLIAGVLYGHFIWSQRHIPVVEFPWI